MAAERAVRDRAATRAFILGLLGLWFGLFAPFAVWSGAWSLRRIRASDGELRGAWSATVGLVAGLIGLAFLVLGAVYWFLAS